MYYSVAVAPSPEVSAAVVSSAAFSGDTPPDGSGCPSDAPVTSSPDSSVVSDSKVPEGATVSGLPSASVTV